MSVFMTPEQKPFWCTYFRKPDFMNLCKRVDELWNDKEMRSKLEGDAELRPPSSPKSPSARPIPTPSCIRAWSLTPSRASKTPTTRVLAASAAPQVSRPSEPVLVLAKPSEPRIKTASAWSHIPAIKWPPAASMINSVAASPATPSTNAGCAAFRENALRQRPAHPPLPRCLPCQRRKAPRRRST